MADTTNTNNTTSDTSSDLLFDVESGQHGLRYKADELEHLENGVWTEIEADCDKDSGNIRPQDVSGIAITAGDKSLNITFNDPTDIYWRGTKVVRKVGDYPFSIRDGVVVLDNHGLDNRGKYATTPFVDTGLEAGTTYYYHFFPYTDVGGINVNEVNRVSGTTKPASTYKVYGVQIDQSNSDPEKCVTYTDDAVGMTGGSSTWDTMPIFKDIKPCLFKNGKVVGYLQKNDFTKFENGTSADITSGAAGDVMIEFPKAGLVMSTEGDVVTLKMTDNPNAEGFHYYAHTRDVEGDRDKFYLGAYEGYTLSNNFRSLSGKMPTVNQPIGTFRTQAEANGKGYDIMAFYQVTFLQALYLIRYKNLDSQSVVGKGYSEGNSSDPDSAAKVSGITDTNGFTYGSTTDGMIPVKLFGLENIWGNCYQCIDGLVTNSNCEVLTATTGFNDSGLGYKNNGTATPDSDSSNSIWMIKAQGTSETGFIKKEGYGIYNKGTYFCDSATLHASKIMCFGGNFCCNDQDGIFHSNFNFATSFSGVCWGARLMYL